MRFKNILNRFCLLSDWARSVKLGAAVVIGAVVYSEWNGSIVLGSSNRHDTQTLMFTSRGGGDEAQRSAVRRHILLVRHGQYVQQSVFDEDRSLTPLGQMQAELTGQTLKDMGFHYTILLSSTMTRAQETAEIIHKYLPHIEHVVDETLAEVDVPPVNSWRKELKQFFENGHIIEKAFRKYFKKAEPGQKHDTFEIIVCHANVIRYFINRTLPLPSEIWRRFPLPNCSITHLVIQPTGKVNIEAIATRDHIPRDKLTFL